MTTVHAPIPKTMPTGGARRIAALGAAIGVGAVAAFAAVVLARLPPRATVVVLGAVLLMVVATVVGNVERLLLAAIVLDLPLQIDVNLGYRHQAADLGAFGGLNISVTTVALFAVFGGLVLRWLLARPAPPGLGVAVWPLGCYVVAVAASVVTAGDRVLAAYWVLLLVQTFFLFVYLARVLRSRDDLLFVASMLVAGLLVESLIMWWQWFGHPPTPEVPNVAPGQPLPSVSNELRMTGTFGSPNAAGAYLAMFLPLAATMVIMPVQKLWRWTGAAAFASGVFALVVTFSRGSWVAFAIAATFLIGVALRRRLVKGNVVAVLGAVVILAVIALRGIILSRLFGGDAGSASARFPLVGIAWRVITKHPLTGVGANNFAVQLREFFTPEFGRTWLYVVHNDYVLVLAEAGIVALLAYLVFIASIFVRGVPALRSSDPVVSTIALALVAGTIGRLVHMTFDLFNGRPQVEALVIAAAMLAVAGRLAQQEDRPTRRVARPLARSQQP
jgi:hypothetical protein